MTHRNSSSGGLRPSWWLPHQLYSNESSLSQAANERRDSMNGSSGPTSGGPRPSSLLPHQLYGQRENVPESSLESNESSLSQAANERRDGSTSSGPRPSWLLPHQLYRQRDNVPESSRESNESSHAVTQRNDASTGDYDILSSDELCCCICQVDCVDGDEIGELNCGHEFHAACIEQWLKVKNACPLCKRTAIRRI